MPRAELLRCAKHLFVAAMMAGVHPGLPRIGKSGHDGGASAFGAGEVFRGQQKQSAAVITGRRAFAPCPAICYSAPKICSWQPRCRFFPAGVRMKKASLPLVLTGLGFNPNGPRGLARQAMTAPSRIAAPMASPSIAELMAERKKLELGCARLLDLLPQVHGEPRPTLFRCACERCPGLNAQNRRETEI